MEALKEKVLDTYDSNDQCITFEYENIRCNKCDALLTTEYDRYNWLFCNGYDCVIICPI